VRHAALSQQRAKVLDPRSDLRQVMVLYRRARLWGIGFVFAARRSCNEIPEFDVYLFGGSLATVAVAVC